MARYSVNNQIEADQSQIAEFQKLIDSLSAKKEDAHE